MIRKTKAPFALGLAGVAVRSYVLWSARILILSWYTYFVLEFAGEKLQGGGYLAIAMMLLSIFGLFQLIELAAKLTGLKEPPPRAQADD